MSRLRRVLTLESIHQHPIGVNIQNEGIISSKSQSHLASGCITACDFTRKHGEDTLWNDNGPQDS